jgi:diguanylate cyclase (GGDEF)-like protein
VTLRARLTIAFLAVVLGPVLLGAGFVAVTVGAVSDDRARQRLDLAATGIRTAMDALCQQLTTAAETAALLGGGGDPTAAQRVVDRRLAAAVQLTGPSGATGYSGGVQPPRPWADCAGAEAAPTTAGTVGGVAAHVEMLDPNGGRLGYAYAVEPVDLTLVNRLATAGGSAVTVLAAAGPPATRRPSTILVPPTTQGPPVTQAPPTAQPRLTTERARDLAEVIRVAAGVHGTAVAETVDGRCVRRVDPGPGQPLSLALSVGHDQPRGLYLVLVAVVAITAGLSVTAAWLLARSTTRPLIELSGAADRVAGGDLGARVPVRTGDEVGRLGVTFNRMAREMQGYVQALTASRDQLRGHLGLLGDTLSSTHDVDRILEVILESALAATGAQAGVLLLVDPAAGVLVGRCGQGLVERGPAGAPLDVHDLRVRMGQGLLGEVAASGVPRRGRVDLDGARPSGHEPLCRTYVAVPFAAPGTSALAGPTGGLSGAPADPQPEFEPRTSARGVLALYDRHGRDEFDDADLVTLRTFAGQAAVALDNVRIHEEAQRLSLTDPLTGLSNYRYLKESLRREVERASRFSHQLTVIALDLDRFKDVNDRYGHAAGDAVLAEFARRLRAEIREVDLAFRQGGEEFVLLLPETDAGGGMVVAERVGAATARTPVLARSARSARPARIPFTVSIGIAVYPDHGTTGDAVLEAADEALYQAKAAGRNTCRVAGARGEPHRGQAAATSGGAPNPPQPPHARRGR